MSACIGWAGDCDAWGPNAGYHGCKFPSGHREKCHQCLCGERRTEAGRTPLKTGPKAKVA